MTELDLLKLKHSQDLLNMYAMEQKKRLINLREDMKETDKKLRELT